MQSFLDVANLWWQDQKSTLPQNLKKLLGIFPHAYRGSRQTLSTWFDLRALNPTPQKNKPKTNQKQIRKNKKTTKPNKTKNKTKQSKNKNKIIKKRKHSKTVEDTTKILAG